MFAEFFYDESGSPYALLVRDTSAAAPTEAWYYYVTNLQGDVVMLLDASGTVAAEYSYNAWGKPLSATGAMAEINPIRYRGYYYDAETGFYYLQSRYYDPVICRFLNADGYASTGQGVLGCNMFAYCGNDAVNYEDRIGLFWEEIKNWFDQVFGSESQTVYSYTTETDIFPDPLPITIKKGITTSIIISSHGDASRPISVYLNNETNNILESSVGLKINCFGWNIDFSLGLTNTGISINRYSENNSAGFGLKLNLLDLKLGFETTNTVTNGDTIQTSYSNVSANGFFLVAVYMFMSTGQVMPSSAYSFG